MITDKFIKWLVEKISAYSAFRELIKSECHEYYLQESLKHYRIWGEPERVFLGEGVQLNNATLNTVSGKISIGAYAFLGHNVSLLTGTHNYALLGLERQVSVPGSGRDIIIGEGVWIGSNATILGPCIIGDNAVIGAGAVVTGNVEEGCVYSGIPAKRKRGGVI